MYSREQKEHVLAQFHACGMSMAGACRELAGFPNRKLLSEWLREEELGLLDPPALRVRGAADRPKHRPYSEATRREAVRLVGLGQRPADVARRLGVANRGTVSAWARAARGGKLWPWAGARGAGRAEGGGMDRDGAGGQTDWSDWAADLPDDPAERAEAAERRLKELAAVLDVLKAPGPGSLSNREKWMAGQRARAAGARLRDVCSDLAIPKSTYCAQAAIAARPDKYGPLRARVALSFERGRGTYGAERVTADLRRPSGGRAPVKAAELEPGDTETPVVVSERVVRRIMAEEGLVPVTERRRGRRRYSSYAGEPDERPANLLLRGDGTHDFRADEPFGTLVTDVTEFRLPGFKCYLSPFVDCHDGDPVSWSVSTRPDDELTSSSLIAALLKAGHGFLAHTDGGGNYRSAMWKAVCAAGGVERSMSRKGRSPDNARAEGFFGTLKREFLYWRDWTGVTFEEFAAELAGYLDWYVNVRIKKSLGWKTIREHREELGVAV